VSLADARGERISASWAKERDAARARVEKLEESLLKDKGRVQIITVPEGVEVTIVGQVRPGPADKSPLTRYLVPGTHVVRVVLPASGAAREVSFPVGVGQSVEVDIDLGPEGRSEVRVNGRSVGGEDNPELRENPPEVLPNGVDATDEVSPLLAQEHGLWTRLGTAGISLGGAAIAVGIVFALQGAGLDDEASCSGDFCEVDAPLRALVRADSDTAWSRATGAFITGGVLLAGGIVAVVLDPHRAAPEGNGASKPRVTPWLSPDGAGLSGIVSF
jgi:hypothetical protein